MKKRNFLIALIMVFIAEATALAFFSMYRIDNLQDAVVVNEAVQAVLDDWDAMEDHRSNTELDYTVLDADGKVIFQTREGLSESINAAVIHRDTILDIEADGGAVGKIIIYNDVAQALQGRKRMIICILSAAMFLQCCVCIGYGIYLNHIIINPFRRLQGFAERIAGGNLDVPLDMDRQNLFGAFTESFDIMRAELKKARIAEAQANADKKELVAKLSHDIKTPVASIKAASEVGIALTDDGKIRDNYTQIIRKADQINTLITNLFTATLEELEQLSVTPSDVGSERIGAMLASADYLDRAVFPDIPDCLVHIDELRLQQVFDNIFANSYKYANTQITVTICRDGGYLAVGIEDYGGGVSAEELPLLKEKYRRGSNTGNIEGAGLGLFISDYFMKEMQGELAIQNGENGLKATVRISLSGVI